jgi:hypothetical protein
MSLVLDGTNGLSDIDGSAATPAIRGTDANTGIFFPAADTIAFAEGGAEVMRLDSSGNLLVGTTSASAGSRLKVTASGSSGLTYVVYTESSAATGLFSVTDTGSTNFGLASFSPYNYTTASAANAVLASNGALQRSTSSLKYKTDVNDATHGLAEVLALRPVTYKGKNDGDLVFGGLIAEEVHEAGLTEFVQYAEDGSPDSLAYANMVSLAFKAIQELKAIVDAQGAEIAALKGTQP